MVGDKPIKIAVGVIRNPHRQILIAKRPLTKHLGGFWEFPGGKVEHNESVLQALKRELFEELGIEVQKTLPLMRVEHQYPDKLVELDVHWILQFAGSASGLEGQEIQWVDVNELRRFNFPSANVDIVNAIACEWDFH